MALAYRSEVQYSKAYCQLISNSQVRQDTGAVSSQFQFHGLFFPCFVFTFRGTNIYAVATSHVAGWFEQRFPSYRIISTVTIGGAVHFS